MDTTIKIIAFYVVSLALMVFAIYFASKKHVRMSGLILVLSFLSFVLAQFMGAGLLNIIHGLTLEQLLCWGFGLLFLCIAIYFIHEKALAYGFALSIISVVSCFFGFSSVQALLKTHMLWMVTDSIKSYGDKLDTYQSTVAEIQRRVSEKQVEFESNQTVLANQMERQGKELDFIQSKIRDAETNIIGQQSDITNQYRKIVSMQSDLKSAQTNLDAQQKSLSDVTYWVQNLFDNTTNETISLSDTNKAVVRNLTNSSLAYCLYRLSRAPIKGSVEAEAVDTSQIGYPVRLNVHHFISNLSMFVLSGFNTNSTVITFRYVIDTRETNLYPEFGLFYTNILFTKPLLYSFPDLQTLNLMLKH